MPSTSSAPTVVDMTKIARSRAQRTDVTDEPTANPDKKEKMPVGKMTLSYASESIVPSLINWPGNSTFIPSFHNMFAYLREMQTIASQSTYLHSICPSYLTLSTTIYYSILGFMKILHARNAVGMNSTIEGSTYRRFFREFPPESLVIAGPIAGFFEALGAVKLPPGYGHAVPAFPDFLPFNTNGQAQHPTNGYSRIPMIPMLITLWRDISTNTNMRANAYNCLYWASATVNKLGIRFNNAGEYSRLVYSAGWYVPRCYANSAQELNVLRVLMQRSVPPPDMTTINYSNVANFTGMIDKTPLTWFRQMRSIAEKEASLFEGATTFAAIPDVGTNALLVETYSNVTAPDRTYTPHANANAPCIDEDLRPSHANLRIYSRTGGEMDFKIGAATGFHQYINGSAHFDMNEKGPWFGRHADNLALNALQLRSAKPVFLSSSNVINPTRFANIVIRETFHHPDGYDKNKNKETSE